MAALELPLDTGPRSEESGEEAGAGPGPTDRWPREALDLLDRAQERLRSGDWAGYGQALDQLRALLERLQQDSSGGNEP
jgi:hypothetical protein